MGRSKHSGDKTILGEKKAKSPTGKPSKVKAYGKPSSTSEYSEPSAKRNKSGKKQTGFRRMIEKRKRKIDEMAR